MKKPTAFIHHPIYQRHDTGPGHPESPERYSVIVKTILEDPEISSKLQIIEPEPASQGIIQAVHTKSHYTQIKEAFASGITYLDADTLVSMHSFEAACYGVGGAIAAVDAVLNGQAVNAFVAVRPPGHHSSAERAMGFCLFNNVAVAARYAQNQYKEVEHIAVIDWDVHHGNGTQGIFYSDPTVFFFSIHQYPWYPGTGSRGETGQGRGLGTTLNVPLRAETPASVHRSAFEAALEEIASKFKPDLIFISAGFDAHISDPLGQLMLEDADFQAMTRCVMQWAEEVCDGRLISCLEGGYNLSTLGRTVKSHVLELMK